MERPVMASKWRERLRSWLAVRPSRALVLSMLRLSAPLAMALVAEIAIPILTVLFLGHLGTSYLGAYVLAAMYCNGLGSPSYAGPPPLFSPSFGFLCPQGTRYKWDWRWGWRVWRRRRSGPTRARFVACILR